MKWARALVVVSAIAGCGGGGTGGTGGGSGGGGGAGGGSGGGTGGGTVDAGHLETSHGGQALAAWMKSWWEWGLAGAAADAGRGMDVVFLSVPDATNPDGGPVYSGTISVSLQRGDSFALPLYAYTGERYLADSGTPDDPTTYPPDSDYTGSAQQLVLTLDGVKIIDSTRDSLTPYFYPAQTFSALIPYSSPTSYGAIGALWNKGLGVLHTPLPSGSHTLHVEEFNSTHNFGFSNTWNITVP